MQGKHSRLVIIAILAEVALGIAWGVSLPDIPGGYAVVVGVEDYPGTANDLIYPAQDLQDTVALLERMGFAAITSLADSSATKSGITTAIQQMAKRMDSNDVFFFYFSGHGNDDPSIVPYDAALAGSFTGSELAAALACVPGTHQVCVFDSCMSGDLIAFLTKNGRCVISGGAPGELTYEYSSLENGVFTYYWLQSFTSAATGGSDYAPVGTAFTWLFEQVHTISTAQGHPQHPQINNQVEGGGVMNFTGLDSDDGVRAGLGAVFIIGLVLGGVAVVVLGIKRTRAVPREPANFYDLGPVGHALFTGSQLSVCLNLAWADFRLQFAGAIGTLSQGDQALLRDIVQDPHDARLLDPTEFRRFFASIAIRPPSEEPVPAPPLPAPALSKVAPSSSCPSAEWIPLDENTLSADAALNSSVITLLNETRKEARAGNKKTTKRYLRVAIKLCSKSLTCMHNASVLFLQIGNYKDAEETLRKMLQFEETSARAWNMLGFALFCQDQWQGAFDAYSKAAKCGKLDEFGAAFLEKTRQDMIPQ